jgi:hypothetical protein
VIATNNFHYFSNKTKFTKLMNDDHKFRAALRSTDKLHNCIDNREKYLPETVEAAVEGLQSRGVVFTEEELTVIREDMQARRDLALSDADSSSVFSRDDKSRQVEDPDAPAFYSKRLILVFSILFSVLFGSVMLAINVSKMQNLSKAVLVVLFGLGFTVLAVAIAATYHLSSPFSILFGYLGAYAMEYLFWRSYIGNATLYRAKPFWPPLITGVALIIPLIIFLVKYSK